MRISIAETVVRLPATVWGALAIYWLYRLGRRLHSPRVGLIAASLLAVSAFHIRYSQEVRFYSLFVFLALVSTELLLKAYETQKSSTWVLYAFVATLSVYAHYFTLLMLGVQGLWVVARVWHDRSTAEGRLVQRRTILAFGFSAAFVVLVFLPWLIYDGLNDRILKFAQRPEFGPTLILDTVKAFSGESNLWWPLWVILALLGLLAWWRRDRPSAVLLAVWTIPTLPVIIFLDQSKQYFYLVRQMLFALPAFLLLVAAGVDQLGGFCPGACASALTATQRDGGTLSHF